MYRTKELYDEWNETKKEIHFEFDEYAKRTKDFYVNEKEIRYIRLWVNIGYEENGKKGFLRPVLVIKKVGNLFFVVAMTSKGKEKNRFYHNLVDAAFNEKNKKYKDTSYCILSQVRVVDKKRFTEMMWLLGEEEFLFVKQKLKELLL